MTKRLSDFAVLHRDFLLVDDVKLLRHQRMQLAAIVFQMIQHFRHCTLHVFKRFVPLAQRFLAQELPHPLDQVDIGGVRWDLRQVKLRMPFQPLLDDWTAVVFRPINSLFRNSGNPTRTNWKLYWTLS